MSLNDVWSFILFTCIAVYIQAAIFGDQIPKCKHKYCNVSDSFVNARVVLVVYTTGSCEARHCVLW